MRSRPGAVAAACENGRARRGRAVEVDVARARGDVVEQRRVGDAAREHAVDRQPVPGARARRQRHAPALRLEAEQPAPRGGDADRAGAVGAERRADEAGRDRRRAAAAGPARRALQVPRVARRAERRRLGERPDAQLGHVASCR